MFCTSPSSADPRCSSWSSHDTMTSLTESSSGLCSIFIKTDFDTEISPSCERERFLCMYVIGKDCQITVTNLYCGVVVRSRQAVLDELPQPGPGVVDVARVRDAQRGGESERVPGDVQLGAGLVHVHERELLLLLPGVRLHHHHPVQQPGPLGVGRVARVLERLLPDQPGGDGGGDDGGARHARRLPVCRHEALYAVLLSATRMGNESEHESYLRSISMHYLIFCLRNSILAASPWTSMTLRGSQYEISCIIPVQKVLRCILHIGVLSKSSLYLLRRRER